MKNNNRDIGFSPYCLQVASPFNAVFLLLTGGLPFQCIVFLLFTGGLPFQCIVFLKVVTNIRVLASPLSFVIFPRVL